MRSWTAPEIYRPIPRNAIVYEGPSRLTGDRIIVVATAQNGNRKIGAMLQFWIIPAISPLEALRTGADRAVCGDCRLRGDGHGRGRACYVYSPGVENIWQAVTGNGKGKGRVNRLAPDTFAAAYPGLQLRIGAYGDPMAVPLEVWSPLLRMAGGWTAYSHQWRRDDLAFGYRTWCMASVDSVGEQREAMERGWRTFRVRPVDGPVLGAEIVCPHEGNQTIKCASCSLCRGSERPAKSIVVTVHGVSGRKHFAPAVPVEMRPRLVSLDSLRSTNAR